MRSDFGIPRPRPCSKRYPSYYINRFIVLIDSTHRRTPQSENRLMQSIASQLNTNQLLQILLSINFGWPCVLRGSRSVPRTKRVSGERPDESEEINISTAFCPAFAEGLDTVVNRGKPITSITPYNAKIARNSNVPFF